MENKIEHIKKCIVAMDTDNPWERYQEAKRLFNNLDFDFAKYGEFLKEITEFLRKKYDDFQQ